MTAGAFPLNQKLVIYRGAAGSVALHFTETSTGDDINLSGSSPFVAWVRRSNGQTRLLELDVADTDLVGGEITLSWNAEDTDELPIGPAQWGLMDANDILWIQDVMSIKSATPATLL